MADAARPDVRLERKADVLWIWIDREARRNALNTTLRAVVVPPMNSPIKLTDGSATTPSQSVVSSLAGSFTARDFLGLRTATRTTRNCTPSRDIISRSTLSTSLIVPTVLRTPGTGGRWRSASAAGR